MFSGGRGDAYLISFGSTIAECSTGNKDDGKDERDQGEECQEEDDTAQQRLVDEMLLEEIGIQERLLKFLVPSLTHICPNFPFQEIFYREMRVDPFDGVSRRLQGEFLSSAWERHSEESTTFYQN